MRTRRPLIAGSVCMQAGELRAGCITGSAVRAHVHVRMRIRTRRPLIAGSTVRACEGACGRPVAEARGRPVAEAEARGRPVASPAAALRP